MITIALATQKGGAGKTTLAASIGVAAQQAGEKVFLVDLDPQSSLYRWGERRRQDEPAVDRIGADKLAAALAGVEHTGYTLAILDTQGTDSASTVAALRLTDLAIIPARPTMLDIEASWPTVSTMARLGQPFVFVLNMAPSAKTPRVQDASRALALNGVLASPVITQRVDHPDAIGLGLGVSEHAPEGRAAAEMRDLWQWLKRRIGKTDGKESSVA
jgi:chromosome partitioning protein